MLETIKDKVVVIKEDKGKVIAITAAVCLVVGMVAIVAHKVCKTCAELEEDLREDDDEEFFDEDLDGELD